MPLTPLSLEGRFVRLEPLRPDHEPALAAIGLDPALWRWTTLALATREDMAAYVSTALEEQARGTALPFVIVERCSGAIVGSTRYHSYNGAHRRLEIGYSWIAPSWQRTPLNTEAKYLLLRHAFDSLGCNRVEFISNAENQISRRALLRLGAVEEGTLRAFRHSPVKGPCDIVQFSIIREEWPTVREDLLRRLEKPWVPRS